MPKLNLGAGNEILETHVNHDLTAHRPEIASIWDLNDRPWPWPDDEFEEVAAISVLEHLKLTLIESLDECWRIIRKGGLLKLKFPLPTSPFFHYDPTHRWAWAPEALQFVDPATRFGQTYGYYTDLKWLIVKCRSGPKKRNCWAELMPRGKP